MRTGYRFTVRDALGTRDLFSPRINHFNQQARGRQTVVATLRNNNVAAILVDGGSSNIALENISVFSSPGSGIRHVINAGKGFRITHCAITRRPDNQIVSGENSRLISTAADAINFIATEGDILVENNDIGFEADDGINIRGMLSRVEHVARDDRTFNLEEPNTNAYRAG